jgi:hypothetical protein
MQDFRIEKYPKYIQNMLLSIANIRTKKEK